VSTTTSTRSSNDDEEEKVRRYKFPTAYGTLLVDRPLPRESGAQWFLEAERLRCALRLVPLVSILWPRFATRKVLSRASLILACGFILVALAQDSSSSLRQSASHNAPPSRRSATGQFRNQVPSTKPVSSNSRKDSPGAEAQLTAVAPQMQIFQDAQHYPTGGSPTSVGVGDFNGDGKADLAVANANGNSVSVLLGNGDGSFQTHIEYPTGSGPQSLAVGDFNGDGKPDLVVVNYGPSGSVSVLLGNGDGSFQSHVDYATGNLPLSVAVGDFNGDGKLDVVVANFGSDSVNVLLGNGDGSFQKHVDFATGKLPRSVAVGDFNGDGKLDLAVTAEGDFSLVVSILLGNGDGSFQSHVDYLTLTSSFVAIGDFNGDGKPDLAVPGIASVSVLLGNGNGTFQAHIEYPTGSGPQSLAVGDFNGDGKRDLAVANANGNSVSVLLGNGDGRFQSNVDYPTGDGPVSVAVGDFNGDGRPDLAVVNADDSSVTVLLGNGDGTLQKPLPYDKTGSTPQSVAVGDFNGDGKRDLAVANLGDNSMSVLLGNGDGTFQTHIEYPTGSGPQSLVVGDFNGDRRPDLAVVNDKDNSVSVLLGNGDGTFQTHIEYPTGSGPQSLAVGDFNGDGKPDLAVANANNASVSVLLGNGAGGFQAHVDYPTGSGPQSLAVGDFNGDGKLDLVVVSIGSNSPFNFFIGKVGVLLGKGDGTFGSIIFGESGNFTSVGVADLEGDGRLDLAVTAFSLTPFQGNDRWVGVLLGNGDGTFHLNGNYASGQGYSSVTVADLNNDGAPDLAFVTPGDAVSILLSLLNKAGTIAGLQSSINPSNLGQPVTLTATIRASGNSGGIPTGTVTFVDGTNELGSQPLSGNGVAILSTDTLAAGSHSITVVYSGDTTFNAATSVVLTQVVMAPDFGMTLAPGSGSVNAGDSAVFTLTATAIGAFSSSVSLSCSVSPTPPLAPTCSLDPTSLTPTAGGSTSTLKVSTTAPTASLVSPMLRHDLRPQYGLWLPTSSLALLVAGLAKNRWRRTRPSRALLIVVLLVGFQLLASCGGGSSHNGSVSTPPGPYTITVNAISGSVTHTTQVTVTVH
jgi:Bacterial Ig-like domain (group 3)/FG-GAP-like repeat/FG-GAP repeat